MLYFTSDLHINHNKDFIYKPRGFDSVYEMNKAIIENWNSIIKEEDTVYILGDLMLGDNEEGIELVKQLRGNIIVILGNHDTDKRIEYYNNCNNIVDIKFADRIRKGKYIFYLSHYPTYVNNKNDKPVWCLSGHTHSKEIFQKEFPCNYNVSIDAHDNKPVYIEDIIKDIKNNYSIKKME